MLQLRVSCCAGTGARIASAARLALSTDSRTHAAHLPDDAAPPAVCSEHAEKHATPLKSVEQGQEQRERVAAAACAAASAAAAAAEACATMATALGGPTAPNAASAAASAAADIAAAASDTAAREVASVVTAAGPESSVAPESSVTVAARARVQALAAEGFTVGAAMQERVFVGKVDPVPPSEAREENSCAAEVEVNLTAAKDTGYLAGS